ncbi:MAG: hypothetical protein IPM66_19675 [Acidobacteriota bacterium]|nr:MAG: hypothetical protein IPM66_19675 [Acidobacteriota bacterium]
MNLPAWLNNPAVLLALLAGSVGALWALSEIIGEFRAETGRALRTWGAWMLIIINFIAASVIFLIAVSLAPGAQTWTAALAIGVAWPTVFRNVSLKLSQPISETAGNENTAVRLEQVYSNIQKLSLQLINSVLTRQRTRLLTRTLTYDLGDIEKYVRRMIAMSPQPVDTEYIDRVMQRPDDDDVKKAFLAAFLMNTFTRSAIDDFLRELKK